MNKNHFNTYCDLNSYSALAATVITFSQKLMDLFIKADKTIS